MGYDDGECDIALDGQHVWQLKGIALGTPAVIDEGSGVDAEYECLGCGSVLLRTPGQPFPGTV